MLRMAFALMWAVAASVAIFGGITLFAFGRTNGEVIRAIGLWTVGVVTAGLWMVYVTSVIR